MHLVKIPTSIELYFFFLSLKLHLKYNPNLVGEEDQEMEAHLRLRRLRARRLTLLAMSNQQSKASLPTDRRPSSSGEMAAAAPAVITAATFFLEKAQKRRSMRKSGDFQKKDGDSPSEGPYSPSAKASAKLERQTAISEATRELGNELERVIEIENDGNASDNNAVTKSSSPSKTPKKGRNVSIETKV